MWQALGRTLLHASAISWLLAAGGAAFDRQVTAVVRAQPLVDLVVTEVAVFDVDTGRLLRGRDLVVRGTRIDRIAAAEAVPPAAKVRIDGRGKVLIPGLIATSVGAGTLAAADRQAYLAWGVTGLGDTGTSRSRLEAWRADLDNGRIFAPRIWPSCGASAQPGPISAAPDAVHGAMERLVQSGATPADALRRYTRDAASAVCASVTGRIRVGESADFVVLDGDPLADIRHTRAIDAVVFRGETFTQAHVRQLRRGSLPAPTPSRR